MLIMFPGNQNIENFHCFVSKDMLWVLKRTGTLIKYQFCSVQRIWVDSTLNDR